MKNLDINNKVWGANVTSTSSETTTTPNPTNKQKTIFNNGFGKVFSGNEAYAYLDDNDDNNKITLIDVTPEDGEVLEDDGKQITAHVGERKTQKDQQDAIDSLGDKQVADLTPDEIEAFVQSYGNVTLDKTGEQPKLWRQPTQEEFEFEKEMGAKTVPWKEVDDPRILDIYQQYMLNKMNHTEAPIGDVVDSEAPVEEDVPSEVQPAEVQPAEVQPAEVQPDAVQPAEVQPAEVQPAEVQPAEVQPAEVQPAEVQPAEVQPDGTEVSILPDLPAELPTSASADETTGEIPDSIELEPYNADPQSEALPAEELPVGDGDGGLDVPPTGQENPSTEATTNVSFNQTPAAFSLAAMLNNMLRA